MSTPIYGLMAAQPKDVFAYLREQPKLKALAGTVTRSSDSRSFEAISYASERANLAFSSVSGVDIIVSEELAYETVAFEGGEHRKYNTVSIYVALRDGVTPLQVLGEFKRAGYSKCEYSTITATAFASAVGGTGDYTGAESYELFVVRAGAGIPVQSANLKHSQIPEVGQDGAGGEGGYEFTGGFSDRLAGQSGSNAFGSLVAYSQEMVDDNRWLRFGFSGAARDANDSAYFPVGSSYDASKGLFGGEHLPRNCEGLISFDDSTSYNNSSITGDLKYNAAGGSLDFTTCRVGDLALVRFDFNVVPQVANTTIEIAMIWQTRDADGNATFTFPLTGTPVFYGTGSVSKTFLNRPIISAYFASTEDVNARALLAIRSDNPIQVAPLATLISIQR